MKKLTSKDGTDIAYDVSGSGQPLVLVSGALSYRTHPTVAKTVEVFGSQFKVYSYDRRGRGDSGDTLPYSVGREVDDIEGLIDEAGGTVFLHGHSSGAALALEATLRLGKKVKKLSMYEAPYNVDEEAVKESQEHARDINKLLGANRRADAMVSFLKMTGMPEEAITGMKQTPEWAMLEALAPTMAYDFTIVGGLIPKERAAGITVPTLVMYGSAGLPFMRKAAEILSTAIPNAELRSVEGQNHGVDPKVLLPILTAFFNS